jgi:DNA-binding NarL/FixJ family response regulator
MGEDRNTNAYPNGPIRVLLADDHPTFRQGIAGILASHGGREMEILLLDARGLSNEQKASSLHLAGATVKRHRANAYEKMGGSSRSKAARVALAREWITVEEVTSEDEG